MLCPLNLNKAGKRKIRQISIDEDLKQDYYSCTNIKIMNEPIIRVNSCPTIPPFDGCPWCHL